MKLRRSRTFRKGQVEDREEVPNLERNQEEVATSVP